MSVQRTPPRARSASPTASPRRPDEDITKTRLSRRIQGLQPEFGLLPPRTKQSNRPTMNNQSPQTSTAPSVVFMPVAPRNPTPFHGEAHEDVEDWLQHYERIARHNGWTAEQRLQNLYFSLEKTARNWFENHEDSLTSWDTCVTELKRTFMNQHRRQRAEDLLQSRFQAPNESVTSFVEDVLRLSTRADPQATEEKILRVLMRGVRENIFGGLVRSPPTTVEGFVTEATNIERALQSRTSHYQRLPGVAALSPSSCNSPDLREIIRDVVREEIQKLLPAAASPASPSIAEIVREEVLQVLQPEVLVSAAQEPLTLSYAAIARRPPPAAQHYPVAPQQDSPTRAYLRCHDD